jgi:deoxyribodipyrimidine photo-lyase
VRTLVLVRRDVRVSDNTALFNASRRSDRGVLCLAVLSPGDWKRHDDAPVKVELWLRSLAEMTAGLEKLNIPMLVRVAATPGDVAGIVVMTAQKIHADAVFANAEYEVNEARRDTDTAAACQRTGVRFELFHDQVVVPPGDIRTKSDNPYSVFTPFKKAWVAEIERRGGVQVLARPKKQAPLGIRTDAIPTAASLGFASPIDPDFWPAGESTAAGRLARFCKTRLDSYQDDREPPAADGTSGLSPYLAIGAISPRVCIAAAEEADGGKLTSGRPGPATWISEIVWREFYRHIIFHFPRVSMGRAFKPATDRLPWSYDKAHFDAWKTGRTGYPMVDAGLRQLAATGWMHNRVRMIVAMFLAKDLFIDWRWGERHFMRHLVDGDLAQNNGGWQWSASTGTDAVPYFRIYNPITQSRTHDPDGRYIRRWIPALTRVPADDIHEPVAIARHNADYPPPIVDRTKTRDRVIKAFRALGQTKA